MSKKKKTKFTAIQKRIIDEACDEELLFLRGYDDCIIGVMERFGMESIVCYDYDKFIQQMITEGMSEEEAVEWYGYNTIGAWHGDKTPCFLRVILPVRKDGCLPVTFKEKIK
jgi:hypothetical protein